MTKLKDVVFPVCSILEREGILFVWDWPPDQAAAATSLLFGDFQKHIQSTTVTVHMPKKP